MSVITPHITHENDVILKLNIPFCYHKCSYCGLPVCSYDDKVIKAHTQAMIDEIRCVGEDMPEALVQAISIEGGSPALVSAALLQDLLRAIKKSFRLADDAQISIQTMPGDYSRALVQKLTDCGVNFWTIGLETANYIEHNLLERPYRFDALTMVDTALRTFPMRDLNFELLYGIPGQTMQSWKHSLDMALAYAPEHLTLTPLRILNGTPLAEKCKAGEITPCSDETVAEFYQYAKEKLEALNYHAYTIYDFAQPGHENRFRLVGLHRTTQLGIGYQADSFLDGVCYTNGHNLLEYIEHSQELPVIANHMVRLDERSELLRFLAASLTLTEGLDPQACRDHFGDLALPILQNIIPKMVDDGYLTLIDFRYRMTPLGIASGQIHTLAFPAE